MPNKSAYIFLPLTSSKKLTVGPLPSLLDGVQLTVRPIRLVTNLTRIFPVSLLLTGATAPAKENRATGSASAEHCRVTVLSRRRRTAVVLNFVFTGLS